MPSNVSMKSLLETGVHFGHRTQKWNPKMQPYIFGQRNGIHIIDLRQTLANVNNYYDMIRDISAGGGSVLFVGTKRQAQETIAREAGRAAMPFVNTRWLGGTLTNWRTIRDRIETLKKLESRRDKGEFNLLTKREALVLERKIEKLQERLGGIREMRGLPKLLVVVDTVREQTAVKEANTLNIPVLALADTNSDPDQVDYIVPANDDAMRSIKLLISAFADAVLEGRAMRKGGADEDSPAVEEIDISEYADIEDEDDDRLLGASTRAAIAKLRDANLFGDDEE
ncbi:MAG: 30S ribosomal protein S2 [bacterium]|nr:30S ribosomal protein S2 [bacterium]